MHSFLTRGNAISTFTLKVLACLTSLCVLSTLFLDYNGGSSLDTVKVVVKNAQDFTRKKHDLGFITFDLEANLTDLFNWNVKELFLYLTAEYSTPKNVFNQITLWDKIIRRGENAVLNYKSMNTKYYFWDDGNGLLGNQNVTLSLSWNVIPNAGLMPSVVAHGRRTFQFPTEYNVPKFQQKNQDTYL